MKLGYWNILAIVIVILLSNNCQENIVLKERQVLKCDEAFTKLINDEVNITTLSSSSGNFGDSKLIEVDGNIYLVASMSGSLQIKKTNDIDSSFYNTTPEISSNWFSLIKNDNNILCLTASFEDTSLRLYSINIETLTSELISIVESNSFLLIDPTLIRVDELYYATYTQIKGNINNSDTTRSNGNYEVILVKSSNLRDWQKQSVLISENTNIEDGSMFFSKEYDKFFFLYEEEIFDKSNSMIRLIQSENGLTWSSPITLLPSYADQEPANMFFVEDKLNILYSSDFENNGLSYFGAKVYLSTFNLPNLEPVFTNIDINLDSSIILYDAKCFNNNLHFLGLKLKGTEKYLNHYSLN